MRTVKNNSKLLESNSSALIHHLNLQKLAKEMFKLRLNFFYWLSGNYLLKYTLSSQRNFSEVSTGSIRRVFYGTESISNLGPKTWDVVSIEFKELCPLSLFKKAIKNDSLISLPTMKDICSKLRVFVKYIIILATFSPTSELLFHYDDYFCYALKLLILS